MNSKSKESKAAPLKLEGKCPECGREFHDHSEYRVEVKLRQHMKDKHQQ